jgi:predicted Na+-dependent transporter
MILAIFSLLAGLALGQRFKVFVLVPAIALVLLVAISTSIAFAQGLWSATEVAVVSVVNLQIGYLAGTAIRWSLAAARASRLRSVFTGGSQSVGRIAH